MTTCGVLVGTFRQWVRCDLPGDPCPFHRLTPEAPRSVVELRERDGLTIERGGRQARRVA